MRQEQIIAMTNRHYGSSIRRRPATWLAAALLVLALAAPSAAIASSPSNAQYEPQNHQIAAGGGGGSGPSAPSKSTIGSLPFTGLDVGVLALAAAALLGAGFALRRLSDPARRSSS
ncbi:MAG TPA: hypothetical protein VH391_08390 [Solirubrobacterales bacterium]|jgi:hypothetical protein